MSVDRDGRRGNQDEITSFLFLDVKVLLATTFSIQISFALRPFFVCKRIEGEGDQEQYENKGSLAGWELHRELHCLKTQHQRWLTSILHTAQG